MQQRAASSDPGVSSTGKEVQASGHGAEAEWLLGAGRYQADSQIGQAHPPLDVRILRHLPRYPPT